MNSVPSPQAASSSLLENLHNSQVISSSCCAQVAYICGIHRVYNRPSRADYESFMPPADRCIASSAAFSNICKGSAPSFAAVDRQPAQLATV